MLAKCVAPNHLVGKFWRAGAVGRTPHGETDSAVLSAAEYVVRLCVLLLAAVTTVCSCRG